MTATIFAPATGSGRAAIAVIRVSGPAAARAVTALAGPLPPPRIATLRALRDPGSGQVLDHGLILWFPAPASFTGEDCVEIHSHGGRAVVAAILAALAAVPGCRIAEPGEFTRRAFLNGKMDLGAVEGLADLIDAETEAQRRQALRQQEGALGRWVADQRATLVGALAAAEAGIDFSDEADVAGDFSAEVRRHVAALAAAIGEQIDRSARAAHIRDGFVVVLTGPPNVGKSTLLNALARREAAIVSPLAGTTRDPVEVQLDLDGYLVHVVDTAGVRQTDDPIEREGVSRALDRARKADLVLWLSEAGDPRPPDAALQAARIWCVATKIDLADAGTAAQQPGAAAAAFRVGAPAGLGLAPLLDAIKGLVASDLVGEAGIATRERHRAALADAHRALAAITGAGQATGLELAAEQLRHVASCLDALVGRIDNDDVLGAIFARFCIGK